MESVQDGGPSDKNRVNLESRWEVNYWCGEFRCDEPALRAAVDRVGALADDVRRALIWGGTGTRAM